MKKRHIGKMTAVLGVSAMLLSGCGLFGPEKETISIDAPPQSEVVAGVENGTPTAGTATEGTEGTEPAVQSTS